MQLDTLRDACAAVKTGGFATRVAVSCLALQRAGMFPLHFWMPRSTAAPAPAGDFIRRIEQTRYWRFDVSCDMFYRDADWGMLILMLGVVTMLLGAVLGLFSVNLKRTLACSSMSQIGFILVGVGMQGLWGRTISWQFTVRCFI
ncbi:MAG: proton-conducting transporter membrane subunit [Christensenellales bacterium]